MPWRRKSRSGHGKSKPARGSRSFQTRRDDWPRSVSDKGFLIRDVAGDLYHVRDADALDSESRKWLWAYVE